MKEKTSIKSRTYRKLLFGLTASLLFTGYGSTNNNVTSANSNQKKIESSIDTSKTNNNKRRDYEEIKGNIDSGFIVKSKGKFNQLESKKESSYKKGFHVLSIRNYHGHSIVDALNYIGYNSSFKSRSQLAKKYGIKNYKGTAKQNTKLLKKLKKDNFSNKTKPNSKEKKAKKLKKKTFVSIIVPTPIEIISPIIEPTEKPKPTREPGPIIIPSPSQKPTKSPAPTGTVVPPAGTIVPPVKPTPTGTVVPPTGTIVPPTTEPTPTGTIVPPVEPTPTGTIVPPVKPTPTGTIVPPVKPTPTGTIVPPTTEPTPSQVPTESPTTEPTPSQVPTESPTLEPTPSQVPTESPTLEPTPSQIPTESPTTEPTPSQIPTESPTPEPCQHGIYDKIDQTSGDDEYCYHLSYVCNECGETISMDTDANKHDFVVYDYRPLDYYKECSKCFYTIDLPQDTLANLILKSSMVVNPNYKINSTFFNDSFGSCLEKISKTYIKRR